MLDRYMEQPRQPPLIPESLHLSSRSSTSHIGNSTSSSSSCITVLSNPSQPQAPALSSSSAAAAAVSKTPTIYHIQQRMWNTSHYHSSGSRLWCLFLITLCLQNFTLIASRSIPQSSLRPSSQLKEEVLQLDLLEGQALQDVQSVEERLMKRSGTPSFHSIQSSNSRTKRSEFANSPKLWPNATIPYQFDTHLSTNQKRKIHRAMAYLELKSCVRFVQKTDEHEYYIKFELHPSRRGSQKVYLTKLCLKNRGIILHELSHLLGFHHEHQRPDRDNYIRILWENVNPNQESQFDVLDFDTYGVEYDFGSIMHYSLFAFSHQNRFQTIALLSNVTTSVENIGRQHSLTKGDFQRLNRMYNCPEIIRTTTLPTTPIATTSTPIVSNDLNSIVFSSMSKLSNMNQPTTTPTTAPPTARPTTAPSTTHPDITSPTTFSTTAPPTTHPTTAPPTTHPTTAPPTTHPATAPPTTRPTAPLTTHFTTALFTTRKETALPTTRPDINPSAMSPSISPTSLSEVVSSSSHSPTANPTTVSVTADSATTTEADHYIYSGGRVALKFVQHELATAEQMFPDSLWLKCTEHHCMLDSCIGNSVGSSSSMTNCPHSYFTLRKVSSSDDHRIRVGDEITLQFMPPPNHPLSGQTLFISCGGSPKTCGISRNCTTQEAYGNPFCKSNILIVKEDGKMDGDFVTSMDVIGFEFRLLVEQTFFRDQCALGCNHETMECYKQRCIFIPNFLEGPNPVQQSPPMRCGKDLFQVQKVML